MQDCGSRGCAACVRHRGFTLIELMIVVAIIIMAATGAVAIGRSDVNTLQANALQVQALFDRARQTALAQRSWTCVVVLPSAGTFKLYLQPSPATTSPTLNAVTQTLTLPSTLGLPVKYAGLSIPKEPLSAYFNKSTSASAPYIFKTDYVGTAKDIYLWFDGFGKPNIETLASPWPGGLDGDPAQRDYGYVTLTTSTGAAVVQIVVYASTGTTSLRWIKK